MSFSAPWPDQALCDQAGGEIRQAVSRCRHDDAEAARRDLRAALDHWARHPAFTNHEGMLRWVVLNEGAFMVADPACAEVAWAWCADLARRAFRPGDADLMEALRIALYELLPEPPVDLAWIERLFALADDPETRWATFAAYEHWPRTFAKHRQIFGKITDAEHLIWLDRQGLEATPRGLRRKSPRL